MAKQRTNWEGLARNSLNTPAIQTSLDEAWIPWMQRYATITAADPSITEVKSANPSAFARFAIKNQIRAMAKVLDGIDVDEEIKKVVWNR